MASLPVLSVWPMMVTFVAGFSFNVAANLSSTARKFGWISARPVLKEISLGISSLRRLSCVCVTCTPVPCVACSMARFCFSMRVDHTLPITAPIPAPIAAPAAVRPPPPPPVAAPRIPPRPAPTPAPVAVPRCVADMSAQPAAARVKASAPIVNLRIFASFLFFIVLIATTDGHHRATCYSAHLKVRIEILALKFLFAVGGRNFLALGQTFRTARLVLPARQIVSERRTCADDGAVQQRLAQVALRQQRNASDQQRRQRLQIAAAFAGERTAECR